MFFRDKTPMSAWMGQIGQLNQHDWFDESTRTIYTSSLALTSGRNGEGDAIPYPYMEFMSNTSTTHAGILRVPLGEYIDMFIKLEGRAFTAALTPYAWTNFIDAKLKSTGTEVALLRRDKNTGGGVWAPYTLLNKRDVNIITTDAASAARHMSDHVNPVTPEEMQRYTRLPKILDNNKRLARFEGTPRFTFPEGKLADRIIELMTSAQNPVHPTYAREAYNAFSKFHEPQRVKLAPYQQGGIIGTWRNGLTKQHRKFYHLTDPVRSIYREELHPANHIEPGQEYTIVQSDGTSTLFINEDKNYKNGEIPGSKNAPLERGNFGFSPVLP